MRALRGWWPSIRLNTNGKLNSYEKRRGETSASIYTNRYPGGRDHVDVEKSFTRTSVGDGKVATLFFLFNHARDEHLHSTGKFIFQLLRQKINFPIERAWTSTLEAHRGQSVAIFSPLIKQIVRFCCDAQISRTFRERL